MNIITNSSKRFMNYEYYVKQLMQMVELNLNKINHENPHLINALDKILNHTLIKRNSHIPNVWFSSSLEGNSFTLSTHIS